jgi:hypothetical protein
MGVTHQLPAKVAASRITAAQAPQIVPALIADAGEQPS